MTDSVRPIIRRVLPLLLAGVCLAAVSCGQPEGDLLRYRFQAGSRLDYVIGLSGAGTVRLFTPAADGGEDSNQFPLEIEGSLRLGMEVESLSPEGVAEISVTYSGIRLTARDTHDGRNLTVVMTEAGIETWDGDILLNEVLPGDRDFILGELSGQSFRLVMDSRGKILELEEPSSLVTAVPYVRFRELLMASQPELPEKRVKPGDEWQRRLGLSLPSLGDRFSPGETFEGLTRYTYLAPEDGDDPGQIRIGITGDLVRSEEEEEPGALLGFSQKTGGMMVFNPAAGRLISSRLELDQELAVLIAIPQFAAGEGIRMETELKLVFEMNPGE